MIPCDNHIPSISCQFWFALVVSGLIDPCLSLINSRSPSLVVNILSFLLKM